MCRVLDRLSSPCVCLKKVNDLLCIDWAHAMLSLNGLRGVGSLVSSLNTGLLWGLGSHCGGDSDCWHDGSMSWGRI